MRWDDSQPSYVSLADTRPILLQTTLLLIALSVFVPFAVLYMMQLLKLNYLWAAMCICAAVYFVFRES